MTALAGFYGLDGRSDAAAQCLRMLSAQRSYGPHDVARWDGGRVAVGRALFRLTPEDRFDCQPLTGGDGNLVLVADVRLDNRDDLVSALGLAAATLCDAQILLAGLERWGEAALDRIVGDFAFALLSLQDNSLLLGRDPLGQRPLHYHRAPSFLAFATMPKGLHALADIPRAPDVDRVAEFVGFFPETGSRTYFNDIRRVEPGHVVRVQGGAISTRRYWEPRPPSARGARSSAEWAEGLRHHMDQAVHARLRGVSGAVATHLSAGLDSSVVTATAARRMALSNGKVVAFTSVPRPGFAGPIGTGRIADEGDHAAALVAQHANIEHVLIPGDASSPLDELERYFPLLDQPIRDLPSAIWYGRINNAIRDRNISILLTGFMGNITMSWIGHERLAQDLIRGRWLRLAREAVRAVRSGTMSWKAALAATFGPYIPRSLWRRMLIVMGRRGPDPLLYAAVKPEWCEARDVDTLGQHLGYRPQASSFARRLWGLQRVDLGNANKGALAGWGVDQRDPTADRRLIEYCLSVPDEEYLVNGMPRALVRRAFADRLPDMILNETRKGYQSADWYEGLIPLRRRIVEEIERLEAYTPAAAILDLPRLRRLAEHWPEQGWHTPAVEMAYRQTLLCALAGGYFLRRASGSNQ